jgi:hypothetical protein
MEIFDIGLAYVWEFDDDFINHLETILALNKISTFRISYNNFNEIRHKVTTKKLHFNFYLDRAWDVEDEFGAMGNLLRKRGTHFFNQYDKVTHAIDKANMHLEFITAGLNVPYSIIIPPYNHFEEIFLSINDLRKLGRPFIIKPCNTTGGGVGVVTGAETLRQVIEERATNSDDKYLLQEKIFPKMLNGNRGWFRTFWAFGEAIPVWWDDQTHLYELLTAKQIDEFGLKKLFSLTKTIAKVTSLDFFSTEIVFTEKNNFVVIDYVNDQCDMRFQSLHKDGVPDSIVTRIINNLAKNIIRQKKQKRLT